ncbi:MAG TPA: FAD:protein FMN transferase [Chloroflexota bacterium]|nr:FAD:protein FMN transferase [Chloroflexota bacterium]
MSLGGDIAVAGEPPQDGWQIQVSDDSAADDNPEAERVSVWRGGVASSSTRVRAWNRSGVAMHHIVDPRTGRPAVSPWRLTTVAAESCVLANTASTAAIVRGDRIIPWLVEHGFAARLVDEDGRVVRVGGWPAEARDVQRSTFNVQGDAVGDVGGECEMAAAPAEANGRMAWTAEVHVSAVVKTGAATSNAQLREAIGQ